MRNTDSSCWNDKKKIAEMTGEEKRTHKNAIAGPREMAFGQVLMHLLDLGKPPGFLYQKKQDKERGPRFPWQGPRQTLLDKTASKKLM